MSPNLKIKKHLSVLAQELKQQGFAQIKVSHFLMVRQRGPFVDTLSAWTTISGRIVPLARLWSYSFPALKGVHNQLLKVERCAPIIGGEFSRKEMREGYLYWNAHDFDFIETVEVLSNAVRQVAVPWFDSVNCGEALVRESALNGEFWRTVRKVDRESMAERTDRMLSGDEPVPAFVFCTQGQAKKLGFPELPPEKPVDVDEYKTVNMPVPEHLKATGMRITTFVKKKKAKPTGTQTTSAVTPNPTPETQ